jgi:hypothetical protein
MGADRALFPGEQATRGPPVAPLLGPPAQRNWGAPSLRGDQRRSTKGGRLDTNSSTAAICAA